MGYVLNVKPRKNLMAKLTLFDFINGMMQDKKEFDFSNPEVLSAYEPFWINRWLSMCDMFLPFIAQLNLVELPKETHYNFLKNILPKKKVYLKYIKKPKDLSAEQMKVVAKHFKTNQKNAEVIIQIISEDELTKIINIYQEGE